MNKVYDFIIPETLIQLIDKNHNEKLILNICKESQLIFTDENYYLIESQSNGEPDVISSENESFDVTLLPVKSLYRGIGKDNTFDLEDIIIFKDDYEMKLNELIISAIKNKKHEENIIIFDLFGVSNLRNVEELEADIVTSSVGHSTLLYEEQLKNKKLVYISPFMLTETVLIRLFINGEEVEREFLEYWDERFVRIDN
jgi:hypothetical protein